MLIKLVTTQTKRAITDSLTFMLPKVKVRVNQGVVRGCVEKLPDGKPFQRFSGIPFAKSPINELRFKSPQKLLKFDQEEIDCTREREFCFHKSPVWLGYQRSEDCLNLNVYVPTDYDSTKKLPVMVWIHGGGFAFDSNRRDFYSPEYLLMENVIVVTINYRLHVLGFMSLPSKGISGNAGLKDQQMALEWVHENISNFNGDPSNICLFGEAAGAACAHLHVLNDKSRSFLSKVILQSGTAIGDWVLQLDAEEKTRRIAKRFGSKGNSDDDHYEALMKATPKMMYEHCTKAIDPDERRNMPLTFKPIVEVESDDAFISKFPIDLMKEKEDQLNIPMIIGLNNGDGMKQTAAYLKKLHGYSSDTVKMIPLSVDLDPYSQEAQGLAKDIKLFYFGRRGLTPQTVPLFVNLNTDFYFTIPMTIVNEIYARYQPNCKQFVYEFGLDSELNFFKKVLKMKDIPGACHFDEVSYLFEHKITGMKFAKESREYRLRQMMCKFWTNFAKFSDPTPNDDYSSTIKWNPVIPVERHAEKVTLDYLKIENDELKMHRNMCNNRMNFWRGVYKKHNQSFLNPKFISRDPKPGFRIVT